MKLTIWIACIIALLLTVAAAYYLIAREREPDAVATGTGSSLFPGTIGTAGDDPSTRTIRAADGQALITDDFIDNGITFEDPANEGTYFLAGELGYCLEDGTCPSTGTDDFSIVYYPEDQSFIIALSEEPLGEVRSRAEQYLMNALGLTPSELCSLNYSVGTTVYVNQTYSSYDNLGFSFCEGATRLP